MKLQVFSIHDEQVNAFMTPYFLQSEGQAVRSFSDEVNRVAEDNILFKHSADFGLYYLGTFDSDSGLFDLVDLPRLVVRGSSVVVKRN